MNNDDKFKLHAPIELLECLRKDQEFKGLPTTDYRLAKILGITQTSIIKITKHGGSLSDETAIKLADELKISRAYVMACMALHRAHNPDIKEVWEEMAANALKNIAFVVLGFALGFLPFVDSLARSSV